MADLKERTKLAAVIAALIPAFVFALAGVAKISDPTEAVVFLQKGLGLPGEAARPVVFAFAGMEIGLALVLTYAWGRALWPGVAALVLLTFFFGMLVSVAVLHPHESICCGCFGSLQIPWGDRSLALHFLLNTALAALLAFHLLHVHRSPGKA